MSKCGPAEGFVVLHARPDSVQALLPPNPVDNRDSVHLGQTAGDHMPERDVDDQATGVIKIEVVDWCGECHGVTPGGGSHEQEPWVGAEVENR